LPWRIAWLHARLEGEAFASEDTGFTRAASGYYPALEAAKAEPKAAKDKA